MTSKSDLPSRSEAIRRLVETAVHPDVKLSNLLKRDDPEGAN